VDDSNDDTAIWAHHLTREEGKPKLQWLSYGIENGNTQTKINKKWKVQWKKLSPTEQAATTEKLKPHLRKKVKNRPKARFSKML